MSTGNIAPYLALITSEHNNQPNYAAALAAILQGPADQLSVAQQIAQLFDLDTAVGQQLDYVGQWIGPTRELDVALSGVYFSFDTVGLGFDQGDWAPNSEASVLTALPDDTYRLLLYATVATNHWDGTVPGAEAALNSFWQPLGYTLWVVDNQDMTMSFYLVGPPLSAVVSALYFGGYLDVVPAGVGVAGHYYVDGSGGVPDEPIFGFDVESAVISGFDVGYWDGSAQGLNFMAFAQGTGQLTGNLPAPVVPDGTLAIFGQINSVFTAAYTYAGSTVAAGSSLTAMVQEGAAVGNHTVGIFALGNDSAATNSYTYAGSTVAASTSLGSNILSAGAAAGIATEGIFAFGVFYNTATAKFTYAGSTVTAGGALVYPGVYAPSAAGCSTFGIFATQTSSNYTTHEYTYSGDLTATSTALPQASSDACACGNNTLGVFMNTGSSASSVFNYAGATTGFGTSLGSGNSAGFGAAGNSVKGVITVTVGSGDANTVEYTYSGATVAAGTNLGFTSQPDRAVSNGIAGVTM